MVPASASATFPWTLVRTLFVNDIICALPFEVRSRNGARRACVCRRPADHSFAYGARGRRDVPRTPTTAAERHTREATTTAAPPATIHPEPSPTQRSEHDSQQTYRLFRRRG